MKIVTRPDGTQWSCPDIKDVPPGMSISPCVPIDPKQTEPQPVPSIPGTGPYSACLAHGGKWDWEKEQCMARCPAGWIPRPDDPRICMMSPATQQEIERTQWLTAAIVIVGLGAIGTVAYFVIKSKKS